jgi:hypothetical protein
MNVEIIKYPSNSVYDPKDLSFIYKKEYLERSI